MEIKRSELRKLIESYLKEHNTAENLATAAAKALDMTSDFQPKEKEAWRKGYKIAKKKVLDYFNSSKYLPVLEKMKTDYNLTDELIENFKNSVINSINAAEPKAVSRYRMRGFSPNTKAWMRFGDGDPEFGTFTSMKYDTETGKLERADVVPEIYFVEEEFRVLKDKFDSEEAYLQNITKMTVEIGEHELLHVENALANDVASELSGDPIFQKDIINLMMDSVTFREKMINPEYRSRFIKDRNDSALRSIVKFYRDYLSPKERKGNIEIRSRIGQLKISGNLLEALRFSADNKNSYFDIEAKYGEIVSPLLILFDYDKYTPEELVKFLDPLAMDTSKIDSRLSRTG